MFRAKESIASHKWLGDQSLLMQFFAQTWFGLVADLTTEVLSIVDVNVQAGRCLRVVVTLVLTDVRLLNNSVKQCNNSEYALILSCFKSTSRIKCAIRTHIGFPIVLGALALQRPLLVCLLLNLLALDILFLLTLALGLDTLLLLNPPLQLGDLFWGLVD